ncbi:serine hydrolase domain-containing protein [Sphingobacterium thalpophilum]|nr:serine hydrolase domain-containing protein [Sphingobacterium thalpophilum]
MNSKYCMVSKSFFTSARPAKALLYCCICISITFQSCRKETAADITRTFYQQGKLNGAILLAKDSQIVIDSALGYSNPSLGTEFNTPDPCFYIASLAKPLTAAAIMKLQELHLLRYDDHASAYIKELPKYAADVTIRQLLNHTSGIKDYEAPTQTSINALKNADVLAWLSRAAALDFPPGTKFKYSSSGYILLSIIIERITKKTFAEFLRTTVLAPLDMKHTFVFDNMAHPIPGKVTGFDKKNQILDYRQLTTGDGGIYSTTGDLLKFDKALREGTLLNKENTETMYSIPTIDKGNTRGYGFGWYVDRSTMEVFHTGGLDGFRCLFWRDLKNKLTLIVLTNKGDAFDPGEYLHAMRKTMYDLRNE